MPTSTVDTASSKSLHTSRISELGPQNHRTDSFTGKEWDPETGLYYYRARYDDPTTGRFLSEDPVGFAASTNHYVYVQNNPVLFTDPTGLYVYLPPPSFGAGFASVEVGCAKRIGEYYSKTLPTDLADTYKHCFVTTTGGYSFTPDSVLGSLA